MTRLSFGIAAVFLLAACHTNQDKAISLTTMTYRNEMTLPVIAPTNKLADDASEGPVQCEAFLASVSEAERKTAALYHPHAF